MTKLGICNTMNIKSSQTLVEEANKNIETLSADEVKKLVENER